MIGSFAFAVYFSSLLCLGRLPREKNRYFVSLYQRRKFSSVATKAWNSIALVSLVGVIQAMEVSNIIPSQRPHEKSLEFNSAWRRVAFVQTLTYIHYTTYHSCSLSQTTLIATDMGHTHR